MQPHTKDAFVSKLLVRSRLLPGEFDGLRVVWTERARRLQQLHLFVHLVEFVKTAAMLVWPRLHIQLYTSEMKITSSNLQTMQNITIVCAHWSLLSICRFYFDGDLRRLRWMHTVFYPRERFDAFPVSDRLRAQHFHFRAVMTRIGQLSVRTQVAVPCLLVLRGFYESCRYFGPSPALLVCVLFTVCGLCAVTWCIYTLMFNVYIILLGLNIAVVRLRGLLDRDSKAVRRLHQLGASAECRPASQRCSALLQLMLREQKRIVTDFFRISYVYSKALSPVIMAVLLFLFIFPYVAVFGSDPLYVKVGLIAFYLALITCSVWVICAANKIFGKEVRWEDAIISVFV